MNTLDEPVSETIVRPISLLAIRALSHELRAHLALLPISTPPLSFETSSPSTQSSFKSSIHLEMVLTGQEDQSCSQSGISGVRS
jgi:hypothetical protein